MEKNKILLLIGLLGFTSWYAATPYIAAKSIRDAAEARDAVALASHVDFPAFRESVKAAISDQVTREMAKRGARKVGAFAGMLLVVVTEKLVDVMVTPRGLEALMAGAKPGEKTEGDETGDRPKPEVSMKYAGFDEFEVLVQQKSADAKPLVLILRRHGFADWKLSGLRLPAEE